MNHFILLNVTDPLLRQPNTSMTDQLQRYETYGYYRNAGITATTGDNLKSCTDRKGQATTFDHYDPQNRLESF